MSPVRLEQLGKPRIRELLTAGELTLEAAPYRFTLRTRFPAVAENLLRLYGDYPAWSGTDGDFHIHLRPGTGLARWLKSQVIFEFDGQAPFFPLTANQAFPMLEWGMNWCITNHIHHYLILHAGILGQGDRGLILPGAPGSGKSTLAAILMLKGWRLLSDELGLVDTAGDRITAFVRPVSLKNASIGLIRKLSASDDFSDTARNTSKGDVCHMKPSALSIEHARRPVKPRLILFPTWRDGAALEVTRLTRASALMRLEQQTFNFAVLGEAGFSTLCHLVEHCPAIAVTYGDADHLTPVLENYFGGPDG